MDTLKGLIKIKIIHKSCIGYIYVLKLCDGDVVNDAVCCLDDRVETHHLQQPELPDDSSLSDGTMLAPARF